MARYALAVLVCCAFTILPTFIRADQDADFKQALAERVKLLRDAFAATLADPAFLADIERKKLHVDPVTGEEMAKAFARAFAYPTRLRPTPGRSPAP